MKKRFPIVLFCLMLCACASPVQPQTNKEPQTRTITAISPEPSLETSDSDNHSDPDEISESLSRPAPTQASQTEKSKDLSDSETVDSEVETETTKPVETQPVIEKAQKSAKQDVIRYEDIAITESIPFTSQTLKDETLEEGKKIVTQAGSKGERVRTIRKKYVNDVLTQETEISVKTTKNPVNEIIKIGTKLTYPESREAKTMAKEAFVLLNDIRREAGLNELIWNEAYYNYALIRAKETILLFDHKRPDGRAWYEGAPIALRTENLAAGQISAASFIEAWYNSPGHKANLLHNDSQYGAIAIILTETGYRSYGVNINGN